jgi:hypothetical protein
MTLSLTNTRLKSIFVIISCMIYSIQISTAQMTFPSPPCTPGRYDSSGQCVFCNAGTYSALSGETSSSSCVPYSWLQLGSKIGGSQNEAASGQYVSLSADGTVIAFGEPTWNNGATSDTGRVNVFKWDGTSLTQMGQGIIGLGANHQTGQSLSLSENGNTVVIGSPQVNGALGGGGYVRVYDWDGTTWNQRGDVLSSEVGVSFTSAIPYPLQPMETP